MNCFVQNKDDILEEDMVEVNTLDDLAEIIKNFWGGPAEVSVTERGFEISETDYR